MSELTGVAEVAGAGLVAVAAAADIPAGWALKVRMNGREITVANQDGTFYAVDNACTHAGGPLGDTRMRSACLLECPWHNSVFDVRTGEVIRGPARKPVKTYEVEVQDGIVLVKV